MTVSTQSLRVASSRALSLVVVFAWTASAAFATVDDGGGAPAGGGGADAQSRLSSFLLEIQQLFTGTIGTSIGIIAFAVAGVYIMYARQTGQAVGAIAKVFVGLLIIFGGAALVGVAGGAAF